ncbi:MAG: adenylate/guanylate cyclase domain-containing response regulator [Anaerolineales bacterium]|nr:adenylate/guanylate cyclase domain-containing response regulator [Anaerolineales bacterium]
MNANPSSLSNPIAPGHLLIIDDNKVMRLLLARGLEQQGHSVAMAENGRRGLEILRAEPFDMVLLDIQMPEMDGYQVLEAITSDVGLRGIPVIMVSSLDEVDGVARCIQMGAEDYLFKPPNPILLRARIISSLEKKRLRDQQRELIRKFAASEVADDLLAKGFSLGGHLVQATALFCDIRGFTSLTESQPPSATIELLNDYYSLMFEAITGHGGMVNQIMGDGIMALFGAPAPLENSAQSTVQAALEMIEMIELFNQQQAMLGRVGIRIGIGIATGQMVAGYTGTMQRATYTCVGDTVNLASRLEAYTKKVGQPILIDENTRQALSEDVCVEAYGPVEIRGKANPVNVYSALAGQNY